MVAVSSERYGANSTPRSWLLTSPAASLTTAVPRWLGSRDVFGPWDGTRRAAVDRSRDSRAQVADVLGRGAMMIARATGGEERFRDADALRCRTRGMRC